MTWSETSFLGAGELNIDIYSSAGALTGELDAGNCPQLVIAAPTVEARERLAEQAGGFFQAASVTGVIRRQELRFALTDITRDTLALALCGTAAGYSQSSGTTGATPETIVARLDRWVALARRALNPAVAVVVTNANGTITYTEGSHYEIDYHSGRLRALSSGVIAAAQQLKVGYGWLALSGGYRVTGDAAAGRDVRLRLVGRDIAGDRDCELTVFKARIAPAGDIVWLGEDLARLEFAGQILATASGTWEILFPGG